MKIDLQLSNNEDLEYFKTLFFRNFGTEQMLYYFRAENIEVRIQVAGLDGAQMITVGFFDLTREGKHSSAMQFCPLADNRYQSFDPIRKFWGFNPNQAWASFTHAPGDMELAWDKISEILHIVYKVNNLKAFL